MSAGTMLGVPWSLGLEVEKRLLVSIFPSAPVGLRRGSAAIFVGATIRVAIVLWCNSSVDPRMGVSLGRLRQ